MDKFDQRIDFFRKRLPQFEDVLRMGVQFQLPLCCREMSRNQYRGGGNGSRIGLGGLFLIIFAWTFQLRDWGVFQL